MPISVDALRAFVATALVLNVRAEQKFAAGADRHVVQLRDRNRPIWIEFEYARGSVVAAVAAARAFAPA